MGVDVNQTAFSTEMVMSCATIEYFCWGFSILFYFAHHRNPNPGGANLKMNSVVYNYIYSTMFSKYPGKQINIAAFWSACDTALNY